MATTPRPIEVKLDRLEGPALSPSGDRCVVSAAAADGRRHLFLVTEAGSATQLTAGAGDDWSPRFSADGSSIAFVSNRSGNRDIWVIAAAGGEPRQITTDPADDIDPEWSPDGRRIAFASARGGPLLLYQVTLADLQVFSLTAGAGRDRRPAWSPDGRWVAFESTRDGRPRIWLVPPDGGEARRLSDRDEYDEVCPAWLPDSSSVMALSGRPNAPGGLWIIPVDRESGVPRMLPMQAPGIAVPGQGAPAPALSRDGKRLVFVGPGKASIDIVSSKGGSSTSVLAASGRVSHPSWSPDGRRLVLSSDMRGAWDLWIAGVSSGRLSRLTSDDDREQDPVWSVANGDILFAREEVAGASLYILEPETGRAIKLSGAGGSGRDSDAAWSPDARSIAFVSDRAGTRDLYITPTGGGEVRRLTDYPGSETHPTWSPDGKWIAFARDQGSGSEIWKMPSEGGAPVRISQGAEGSRGDSQPAWDPRGTWIAFTRALPGDEDASDLYIVPPDGGKPFPLHRGSGARITEPAWSPDGSHIAFSQSRPDRIFIADIGPPAPAAEPVPGHPGTPEGFQNRRLEKPPNDGAGQQEDSPEQQPPAGSDPPQGTEP